MLCLVESPITLRVNGPSPELNLLADAFKFRPPDYWRAASYELWKTSDGKYGWDGWLKPLKRLTPTSGVILRGRKSEVLEKARELDIELNTDKLLPLPFQNMSVDDLPDDLVTADFEMDEDQRKCVVAWLKAAMGMNRVTVSGGKTVMFCAAAAAIKRRFSDAKFLYIVQTERLVTQVFTESRKFLPSWDISKFGGGSSDKSGKDMVVATAAMLRVHQRKLYSGKWFDSFLGVLLDECHHCQSETYEKILMLLPAFFRLGASDSLKKDDICAYSKITGLVGPMLEEVEAAPLIESGRIAKPHIYIADVPEWRGRFSQYTHRAELDSDAWCLLDGEWKRGIYKGNVYELNDEGEPKEDRAGNLIIVPGLHAIQIGREKLEINSRWCLLERLYDKAIIRFKERNNLIADWVKYYTDQDMQTLVVCTRTLHILILQALLEKTVGKNRVRILLGEHTPRERDETFAWFRENAGSVLISPLVKEGVSVNEIRAGVVADMIAGWEVANQILGRFMRKKLTGANEAHITWFVDRQSPKYAAASIKMFRKLEDIRGYTYFHPVTTPDSIRAAQRFDEASTD